MTTTSVQTVLGGTDPAALGTVLMHEHLVMHLEHSFRGGMIAWLDDADLAIEELSYFRRAGGSTIVELSTPDIGRDPAKLRAIAAAAGVHIIAGTGFYTEATYPPVVYDLRVPQLAEVMINDLTSGMEGTTIRAGIIGEIGTGRRRFSPAEERVFRAAARAQRATGVAISTHTYYGELALDQVELLREEGVSADRIIIGHLGDKRTPEHYIEIARTGVYLQFDHAGKEEYLRDADRASTIARIFQAGYESQVLISSDVCYKTDLRYYGGVGYDHVLTGFRSHLEATGLRETDVDRILIRNAAAALTPVT